MNRLDLNRKINNDCDGRCNKEKRKSISEDDLCSIVKSNIDSLPIRCVGEWAEQKIYLLYQYFGIFVQGMKYKWKEINYIEICSGPGRCVDRQSKIEFDGTSCSIMQHEYFSNIHKALFFDYNKEVVNILNQRINNLGIHNALALEADYNNSKELCNIILDHCSSKYSLNLVLIDPTDCSVPFDLIYDLKNSLAQVDMIINVAIKTDFNRNIPMAFENKERAKKYERFLGSNSFFNSSENIQLKNEQNYVSLRENFRNEYKESMKKIGYSEFRITPIEHYYDILFASSHKRATEFWDKAQKIKFDGQRELDLF